MAACAPPERAGRAAPPASPVVSSRATFVRVVAEASICGAGRSRLRLLTASVLRILRVGFARAVPAFGIRAAELHGAVRAVFHAARALAPGAADIADATICCVVASVRDARLNTAREGRQAGRREGRKLRDAADVRRGSGDRARLTGALDDPRRRLSDRAAVASDRAAGPAVRGAARRLPAAGAGASTSASSTPRARPAARGRSIRAPARSTVTRAAVRGAFTARGQGGVVRRATAPRGSRHSTLARRTRSVVPAGGRQPAGTGGALGCRVSTRSGGAPAVAVEEGAIPAPAAGGEAQRSGDDDEAREQKPSIQIVAHRVPPAGLEGFQRGPRRP